MKYLWDKLCQHGSTLHNDFPKILNTDSRCKRLECARLAQKTILIAHVIKLHQCTDLDVYCSDSNFTALQFYCLKILYNFWTPYPKFNMSFGQFLRALAKKRYSRYAFSRCHMLKLQMLVQNSTNVWIYLTHLGSNFGVNSRVSQPWPPMPWFDGVSITFWRVRRSVRPPVFRVEGGGFPRGGFWRNKANTL